jgi:hypothetical protein
VFAKSFGGIEQSDRTPDAYELSQGFLATGRWANPASSLTTISGLWNSNYRLISLMLAKGCIDDRF